MIRDLLQTVSDQGDGGGLPRFVEQEVHVHPLGLDSGFSAGPPDGLTSHPAPPPRDEEGAHVLATIHRRGRRGLVRRTLDPNDADTEPADPFAEAAPRRAGRVGASVQGRVALGPARSGQIPGPAPPEPCNAPGAPRVTGVSSRRAPARGAVPRGAVRCRSFRSPSAP